MKKDYNIVFLTGQKAIFYSFLKYLTAIKSLDNPCLISSKDLLDTVKIPRVELIICDPETDPDLINLASEILNIHPFFIPIILLVSNRDVEEFQRSLTRITAIIDPINLWDENWSKISSIRNLSRTPTLRARIDKSSTSDILQMIGIDQWSIIAQIKGLNIKGCVVFNTGVPIYAWSTNQEGFEAVIELLSLSTGFLEVIQNKDFLPIKNIFCSLEEILMSNALNEDNL